jgi:hypothetical protein
VDAGAADRDIASVGNASLAIASSFELFAIVFQWCASRNG